MILVGGDTAFLSNVRGASNPATQHHVFEDRTIIAQVTVIFVFEILFEEHKKKLLLLCTYL
jgi:hypothetical protein